MFDKKRFFLSYGLFFLCWNAAVSVFAQRPPFVDFHIHHLNIPLYSDAEMQYNLWQKINFECRKTSDKELEKFDAWNAAVLKESQANFEELLNGNIRIASLTLAPVENAFLDGFRELEEDVRYNLFSCLTGIVSKQKLWAKTTYYERLRAGIDYLKQHERMPYVMSNGDTATYKLIRKASDIDSVLAIPNTLGLFLNIEGGYALAGVQFEPTAFLERLKSVKDQQFSDIPIFFMALATHFDNPFGGQTQGLEETKRILFSKQKNINKPISDLGKSALSLLLSSKGQPIYVDISNMSIPFRWFYYQIVECAWFLGRSVPVISSHTGISGMDWKDPFYLKNDDSKKNKQSYLNHWQRNLSKQDIEYIYRSNGLIAMSLDQSVLSGNLAHIELGKTYAGSRQRRQVCVKIILANILTVIKTIGQKNAWDMMAVGSDFGAMQKPFSPYSKAGSMIDLYYDIIAFLEAPTAIDTLFSAQEIRQLMYGLTAKEVADKLFSSNGLAFLEKHYPF